VAAATYPPIAAGNLYNTGNYGDGIYGIQGTVTFPSSFGAVYKPDTNEPSFPPHVPIFFPPL
jgi:hypothetical protein